MATFLPIRDTKVAIENTPIVDGQFLMTTDLEGGNSLQIDIGANRKLIVPAHIEQTLDNMEEAISQMVVGITGLETYTVVTPSNYISLGIVDANTVTKNKVYAIAKNTTEYVLNLPDFKNDGVLIDLSYSETEGNGRTQIFNNYYNSWSRVNWSGTWSAWVNSSPSSQIHITTSNYSDYSDIRLLPTNSVYSIDSLITSEMVSNLPKYGSSGVLYKVDMDYNKDTVASGEILIYVSNYHFYYQMHFGLLYTDWNTSFSMHPMVIGGGGQLYGYTDFNQFESGSYLIYTDYTNLANAPMEVTLAGTLTCYDVGSTGYQTFKQNRTGLAFGCTFERHKWNSAWGDWYQVGNFGHHLDSDSAITTIGLPTDLNLYYDNGIFAVSSAVTPSGLKNLPIYGSSGILTIESFRPNSISGIKQTFVDDKNCIWTRIKYSTEWTDWICSTETGVGYFINTCIEKPININSSSHILVFGDSITANSGLTVEEGWVPVLASKFGCAYTNKAISGARFDELFGNSIKAQYESVTNWEDVTHVFLAAGINDATQATNQVSFKTYVQNAIDYIQAHTNAKIIVITPIERSASLYKAIQYSSIINTVAHAKDCSIINGHDFPIPFRTTDYYDSMMQDGLHPTALGQKVYAKYVMNCIM